MKIFSHQQGNTNYILCFFLITYLKTSYSLFDEFLINDQLPIDSYILKQQKPATLLCGQKNIYSKCQPGSCIKKQNVKNSPLNYECYCPNGYFNELEIDVKGEIYDTCKPTDFDPCSVCHTDHTKVCNIDSSSGDVECSCYPEYTTASRCKEFKNGCLRAPKGSTLIGNEACMANIRTGNRCIHQDGDDNYICQCRFPYRENTTLPYPNCQGDPVHPCDRILCAAGECQKSNLTCKCNPGYVGANCTIRLGKTEPADEQWSPWSSCYPDCGNFGYQTSVSLCPSSESDYCIGMTKRWARCTPQGCGFTVNLKDHTDTESFLKALAKEADLKISEKLSIGIIAVVGAIITSVVFIIAIELYSLW